jgi:ATP-dependent protease ClpP protease subunit
VIYLAGDVDAEMYLNLMRRLDKRPNRINVMINSPGGHTCTGLGIYDRLKMVKDCTITANGDCSSAALLILQAAKVRRATLHTSFVIHLSSVTTACECEECKAHTPSAEDMAVKTCLDFILQKVYRYRISEDSLVRALRQKCFGVEKALEWGIIDEIYTGEKVQKMDFGGNSGR